MGIGHWTLGHVTMTMMMMMMMRVMRRVSRTWRASPCHGASSPPATSPAAAAPAATAPAPTPAAGPRSHAGNSGTWQPIRGEHSGQLSTNHASPVHQLLLEPLARTQLGLGHGPGQPPGGCALVLGIQTPLPRVEVLITCVNVSLLNCCVL